MQGLGDHRSKNAWRRLQEGMRVWGHGFLQCSKCILKFTNPNTQRLNPVMKLLCVGKNQPVPFPRCQGSCDLFSTKLDIHRRNLTNPPDRLNRNLAIHTSHTVPETLSDDETSLGIRGIKRFYHIEALIFCTRHKK